MTARRVFSGISAAAAIALCLTACPPPPPAGVAYVSAAPPALQSEVIVASPGAGYAWVPGYWNWGGSSYVWTRGEWKHPPREGATWRAPEWRHNSHGWYSVEGGWR